MHGAGKRWQQQQHDQPGHPPRRLARCLEQDPPCRQQEGEQEAVLQGDIGGEFQVEQSQGQILHEVLIGGDGVILGAEDILEPEGAGIAGDAEHRPVIGIEHVRSRIRRHHEVPAPEHEQGQERQPQAELFADGIAHGEKLLLFVDRLGGNRDQLQPGPRHARCPDR